MQQLAVDVTKRIGFIDVSEVEPWLEKVVLIDKENQYDFSLDLEPDASIYATMVVMLGSKGQVGLYSTVELIIACLAEEMLRYCHAHSQNNITHVAIVNGRNLNRFSIADLMISCLLCC